MEIVIPPFVEVIPRTLFGRRLPRRQRRQNGTRAEHRREHLVVKGHDNQFLYVASLGEYRLALRRRVIEQFAGEARDKAEYASLQSAFAL